MTDRGAGSAAIASDARDEHDDDRADVAHAGSRHSDVRALRSHDRATTQTLLATVIGNWLEFFDFTVYTYFAVMIGKQFFPVGSRIGQLLLSFAAFGVGFLMRPLGSVVLGAYGDRAGRKAALTVTIALMAFGTALIAFTPSYATIGIAAPVLIVVARLVQGFSAGGEVGAATSYLVEVAPPGRRGLFGSLQSATQGLASLTGALAGLALSLTLSEEALSSWGWRVPFALGILIAPVGVFIRRRLPETGDAMAAHHTTAELARSLFTRDLARPLVLGFLAIVGATVSTYVLSHWMTSYAMTVLGMRTSVAMGVGITAAIGVIAGALSGGWASDHHGRHLIMIAPRVVLVLAVLPVFALIHRDRSDVVLLVSIGVLTFLQASSAAVFIAVLPECFPRKIRSLATSVVYAAGVTLFGGTAQVVATWLVASTHNPLSPAWYLIAVNVVSLVALAFMRVPRATDPLA